MSVTNLLQNTRCYTCYFNPLKSHGFRMFGFRYQSTVTEEIVIPKRIPRGPTDILKALASTIKRDPTAPSYKYHDDPYLIPVSNVAKRTYALSQESGRKAAMWVKQQHPELFQHITAEPPIEAFLAKPIYDEFDDLDDALLLKTIKTASVSDSISVYELMVKHNIPVSEESKLCLLELICFFNETDGLAEELIEERWFGKTEPSVLKKTWKDNGYAVKLVEELPPSARSYSAIILGMIKFFELENALKFYDDAINQGYALSPFVYNYMISCTNFVNEGWPQRYEFMQNILTQMNASGCKPTVLTLNKFLDILCRNPNVFKTRDLALQIIAEVRRFGVEPSLASYYYLLKLFCRSSRDKTISYILEDILDLIEGKEFEIQDTNDIRFFVTAMDLCRFYYNNTELAFRLNRLLWHGKNYDFIGSPLMESAYYRNFFFTLCQGELLETIMENYNFYVPNIYTPELLVMEELIKVVNMNGALDLYPRLWNDIILFEMSDKNKLVSLLLEGMLLNRPSPSDPPSEISVKLAETAFSIFTKTETDEANERRSLLNWTNELLGDILTLCLCARDSNKAMTVFNKMYTGVNKLTGIPSFESMQLYLDFCIESQNVKHALELIMYCHNNTFGDDRKLAEKLINTVALSPAYQTRLVAIYGPSIMKTEKATAKN